MKPNYFLLIFILFSGLSFGQQEVADTDENPFDYVEITGEFDLLVDFSMINPVCATKKEYSYSIIIGTAVIDDYIERISVLVPCLSNEFVRGDLITIKPIKTPKKNIVYAMRNYEKDGQQVSEVFGSEFRAIWGEVGSVL